MKLSYLIIMFDVKCELFLVKLRVKSIKEKILNANQFLSFKTFSKLSSYVPFYKICQVLSNQYKWDNNRVFVPWYKVLINHFRVQQQNLKSLCDLCLMCLQKEILTPERLVNWRLNSNIWFFIIPISITAELYSRYGDLEFSLLYYYQLRK